MIAARLVTGIVLFCVLGCLLGAQDPADTTNAGGGGRSGCYLLREQGPSDPGRSTAIVATGPIRARGRRTLRVDSPDALLRGGDSGPAIVRGEPDKSLLILAVRHDGAVSMPPKSKLAQPEIDALDRLGQDGGPLARLCQ